MKPIWKGAIAVGIGALVVLLVWWLQRDDAQEVAVIPEAPSATVSEAPSEEVTIAPEDEGEGEATAEIGEPETDESDEEVAAGAETVPEPAARKEDIAEAAPARSDAVDTRRSRRRASRNRRAGVFRRPDRPLSRWRARGRRAGGP